ncbi:AMP-binding protein [Conexibacter sp. W3-3-2]|uniref:AMP-binding enzyme n=1 Tax=Conexibacter sp. W3-3-2 TaxID=2675227 RepID=UPI0021045E6A|nr:AMP-binding protein [Conexibacter sp. W3-3-2]
MIDWLGPIVLSTTGGSESGMVVLCDSEEWLAHPGTVGRPIADAHVRIIDADGADVPTGQDGEVYVRPPSAWPDFTYEGAADKRAEIDLDGWLTLGDVGHLDADGFLFLTDRVKDMAIVGGVNVYPAEIEQCLMSLAGVRDVAVFGIPDEDLGEVLAAHIDIDPNTVLTEEDVRDHVRRHLAKYKVPRVVVFDDDLPREDSGKLFKRRLRDRYWQQRSRI